MKNINYVCIKSLAFSLVIQIFNTSSQIIASPVAPPDKGNDRIYRHSWINETFLDLSEDFQSGKERDNRLGVVPQN